MAIIKRTAGQRRYISLKNKSDVVLRKLEALQRRMQSADAEGKTLRPLYLMQEITETIERLK